MSGKMNSKMALQLFYKNYFLSFLRKKRHNLIIFINTGNVTNGYIFVRHCIYKI